MEASAAGHHARDERAREGVMKHDDLDRELRAHLEFEADEQRDRGLSAAEAARVTIEMTTTSLFKLLQVEPMLGRVFTPDEDAASPSRVALLGHALWVDRFGSNASIVG